MTGQTKRVAKKAVPKESVPVKESIVKIRAFEDEETFQEGVVSISGVSVTYVQNGDSQQDGYADDTATQELRIYTENAGGGRFLVLETERWAINRDPQEIACLIEDFKKRAFINN